MIARTDFARVFDDLMRGSAGVEVPTPSDATLSKCPNRKHRGT
jgi:hypothetical protein